MKRMGSSSYLPSFGQKWVSSILILAGCFLISELFLYSFWNTSSTHTLSKVLTSSTFLLWNMNPLDYQAKYTEDWIQHQSTVTMKSSSPYFHYALKYFNLTDFDPFSRQSGINVWDLFPPEVSCPDVQRVGNIGEGGKWVCGLTWLEKQKKSQPLRGAGGSEKCIIYSYGVSIETSFEEHMLSLSELKCEIFAFDPTVVGVNVQKQHSANVHFHKQALWKTSGANDAFLLTEHLFDTMNRFNHSFIDILKIDIEGSEWPVFHELFERARRIRTEKLLSGNPSWTLPFGQLLIELHYEDMPSVVEFFSGMAEFEMLPFSREINLQPCLDGRLPFAVEYSFIHASFFDEMHRNPVSYPMPPMVTPNWFKKPKAVIYYLTQKRRLVMMGSALQSLYHSFYQQFPYYDILIFHDDLTASDRTRMQAYVPKMKLTFIEIEFDIPKHLKPPYRPAPLPRVPHCAPNTSTIGYRHMIMFHSTWIHQYLFNPSHGFSDVEYILRLDDDSSFSTPIAYDIFQMMKENNLLYGFVSTLQDDPGCVRGLWNFTWDFLKNTSAPSRYHIPDANLDYFRHHWYEGNVIYNNFELSHVSIWKSRLWKDYMAAVDQSGRVYADRWGDAPLHTIYIILALPLTQIHAFSDLPYRHDPFVNRKGTGLPPPSAYPFEDGGVVCVYYSGWKCQGKNSSNVTHVNYISGGPLIPSWGSKSLIQKVGWENIAPQYFPTRPKRLIPLTLDRPVLPSSSLINSKKRKGSDPSSLNPRPSHPSSSSASSSPSSSSSPRHRTTDVLYTFGHVNKFQLLSETINNFHLNYLKAHPCPVIIFHFANFNSSLIDYMKTTLLDLEVAKMTHFVLVESSYLCIDSRSPQKTCEVYSPTSLPSKSNPCITQDLESLAASRFLVKDALDLLHRLGYDWTFRISDRSLLNEPVPYNLFEYLESHSLKYGFTNVVMDNPICISHLWNKANAFCQSSNCTSLFSEWSPGVVVYTNFEISHSSIWKSSSILTKLLQLSPEDESYQESLYWSDASLHTIAVATTLTSKQIHKFDDIPYSLVAFKQPPASVVRSSENKGEGEDGDRDEDGEKAFPSLPLYHVDMHFHPQRFGWLGGDIGASFILPPMRCVPMLLTKQTAGEGASCSNEMMISSRSIWLFGDSLIGTSNPASRIEAEFISNSVGIVDFELNPNASSPLPIRTIKRSKFYWGSTLDGIPRALFTIKQPTLANKTSPSLSVPSPEKKYWPYDGITIIGSSDDSSPANILVIGQVVTPIPSSTILGADLLSFSISHSLGYLISNPYDSPDLWEYHSVALPHFIRNQHSNTTTAHLNWIAIADSKQRPYTSADETVYLLGSYDQGDPSSSQYDLFQIRKLQMTQILAKVTIHDLLVKNFHRYQLLMKAAASSTSASGESEWVSIESLEQQQDQGQGQQPYPILPGTIAEGSFHFNRQTSQWTVTSLDVLQAHLRVCSSATHRIEERWSCVSVSGIEPKWRNDKKYLTYAGKSHPEFLTQRSSHSSFASPSSSSPSSNHTTGAGAAGGTGTGGPKLREVQSNPFHGVLSYVANPLNGPDELFNEFDRETYCPSFLFF